MIKGIVVAENFSQYATYIRNRNLLREDYEYFKADMPDTIRGLPPDIPVLWLEGWSGSKNMTGAAVDFLKKRFTTHKQVGETFIYGKGFEF